MSMLTLLILANLASYLLQIVHPAEGPPALALWPLHAGFRPWQLLTYAFLHGSPSHLLFNMFGLWMFGRDLQDLMGGRRLLTLYGVSVLSAGLTQLLAAALTDSPYPTVGASGGVFGILLAYALCFPHQRVILLLPPVPLPAWLFASLYALLELATGLLDRHSQVAHFAHLGGMIGAYLLLRHAPTRAR